MRSKEKIEQELEFYKGCLKRREELIENNTQAMLEYKDKIKLLQWVLEDDEQFRDKHRD